MGFAKRLWEAWKHLAHKVARFNSLLLTTLLYFVLLPIVAIPFRMKKDPLRLRGSADFLERPRDEDTLERAFRQG